jgi:hypothetical protein
VTAASFAIPREAEQVAPRDGQPGRRGEPHIAGSGHVRPASIDMYPENAGWHIKVQITFRLKKSWIVGSRLGVYGGMNENFVLVAGRSRCQADGV